MTDKSSDQHVLTDLMSIRIFKNLNQAREKGIQDEGKGSANTLEIQRKVH